MKKTDNSFKSRVPTVHYNPELDKYNDVVLFPHKVAKAKEAFEKFGLPDISKIKNEPVAEENK